MTGLGVTPVVSLDRLHVRAPAQRGLDLGTGRVSTGGPGRDLITGPVDATGPDPGLGTGAAVTPVLLERTGRALPTGTGHTGHRGSIPITGSLGAGTGHRFSIDITGPRYVHRFNPVTILHRLSPVIWTNREHSGCLRLQASRCTDLPVRCTDLPVKCQFRPVKSV